MEKGPVEGASGQFDLCRLQRERATSWREAKLNPEGGASYPETKWSYTHLEGWGGKNSRVLAQTSAMICASIPTV